ncbi:MAG: protein-export membrane protein SecF [Candidatus Fraserbacteria bacterium RBG_16_55_9]|uniref:Protein-export membrane protein SecF n=1 Tax=Fraserbacteria sp. (strain RBG_16_55_9) TaxID=1817864 RepID=A0A1F5US57_FRAXR|nr:MAG: protein-export membrane protein SecF [Candidatus Fraserbacteria bacterium RBG_16_55_9]
MLQLLGGTNINFMRLRSWAFVFSGLLIVLGLIAVGQIFIRGQANLGIEFTGGTSVTLEFRDPVHLEDARALLTKSGFVNPQVTDSREPGKYKLIVRVKEGASGEESVVTTSDRIKQLFAEGFPENSIQTSSSTSIGPVIGQELRQKAVWAILYAIIAIVVYIAFRFDFRFGVSATIAMFHDVLVVIGIMWAKDFLWPTEFTLLIMTAVLTMAGYSLTDKVVVFDRIRENLRKRQRVPLEQLINDSINQVLSRTIITSLTVLLVVVAIFFLGGEVLRDFAFALIIGVVIGTYSSIFIASALLLFWRGGRGKLMSQAAESTRKSRTTEVKSR